MKRKPGQWLNNLTGNNMYTLPCLKLKLTVAEARVIVVVATSAYNTVSRSSDRGNLKNDTIMMAEYCPIIVKQVTSHLLSTPNSLKTYKLSLAVSRSIHNRLQNMVATFASQQLLSNIDEQLLNLGYKPAQQLEISC